MTKVGYKGIVHVHPGYVSVPYNPFEMKTWKEKLKQLELKFESWTSNGNTNRDEGLHDVNEIMQEHFPGKYTVIEAYDPKRGVFAFKLKFDDPHDETIFLLRWS